MIPGMFFIRGTGTQQVGGDHHTIQYMLIGYKDEPIDELLGLGDLHLFMLSDVFENAQTWLIQRVVHEVFIHYGPKYNNLVGVVRTVNQIRQLEPMLRVVLFVYFGVTLFEICFDIFLLLLQLLPSAGLQNRPQFVPSFFLHEIFTIFLHFCYQANQQIYQKMQMPSSQIADCLDYPEGQKIVSLPLEFAYLPVDILSKQFTKLNSPHEYRIHYLGPRCTNTQGLHKKLAYSETSPANLSVPNRSIPKYDCIDPKKVVNSFFINEKLRNNHFYKTGVYYRAFQGMNPSLSLDSEYIFNAAFESGNLDCVIKAKKYEFDLFLRIDSNTRGHLQWFYFSIENGTLKKKIKLNICNISKPGSFYQDGMPPYFFSKRAFEDRSQNWTQGNPKISNITFQQKPFHYQQVLEDKITGNSPYCYSFEYEFQFENDQVFFAYCIPYTYSEMMYDISLLSPKFCKPFKFARSLMGVDIPLLEITDSQGLKNKKTILITGRIHPGETNSSHVLKGFLQFLCSDEKMAKELRKRVTFYIIPMINPDGVLLGNSRSGASGRDLNRMFIQSDRQLFPEIFHLKLFSSKMSKRSPFLIYYDFHGHSRKKNTFFYGPAYSLTHPNYYKCRVLAKLIEKVNNSFRFWSCFFAISEGKKSTGRAFMFQNVLIPFTYTIESSIGYYFDSEKLKTFPYNQKAWKKMGMSICEGTANFIFAYEEYQNFLMERRAIREKKKFDRISFSRKSMRNGIPFDESELDPMKPDEPLKIKYKDREQCFFMKIVEELKMVPEKPPVVEEEASSDDHDEKQDFEMTKLKQFNNLIIQNAQKDQKQKNNMQFTQVNEEKSFSRNHYSKLDFSANNQDEVFQEQLNLFQEIKKKPSSSQGFRKRIAQKINTNDFITKTRSLNSRSQAKQRQSINMAQKNVSRIQIESRNQMRQNPTSLEEWKVQELEFISRKFPPKDLCRRKQTETNSNSARISVHYTRKIMRPNKLQNQHYSEIHFPDSEVYQNKNSAKHCKTDLFRKNIERKRQRIDRMKHESLNGSEISMTKNISKKQIEADLRSNKLVEFKIEDLITNLEYRSKVIKESVKYKEQKKIKAKSNSMFPSSFYGVKQQIHSKRHPTSNVYLEDQQRGGLTIKPLSGK